MFAANLEEIMRATLYQWPRRTRFTAALHQAATIHSSCIHSLWFELS